MQVNYQSDELPPLDDHITINFYRFLQEALNNTAKHSQASYIDVSIGCLDDELVMMVEDDGIGFDVQAVLSATLPLKGMGLQSLQERFYLLGGAVEIYSRPGQGTRLVARKALTG
jgi:signal transduction histidine kinase